MSNYDKHLKTINEFKAKFDKEVKERIAEFRFVLTEVLMQLEIETPVGAFRKYEQILSKVYDLAALVANINNIDELSYEIQREIMQIELLKGIPPEHSRLKEITECLIQLTSLLRSNNQAILNEIESKLSAITDCHFGEGENNSKNAYIFQLSAIEMLSWLFIGDLTLLTKEEIKQDELRRDGLFEAIKNNILEDTYSDIRFKHILGECKNYKKPSYDDLMQVYAYTMLSKVYPIYNNPLCLLISRDNPSNDSVVTKMRNKLFERDHGKHLLILFLSEIDLMRLYDLRKTGSHYNVFVEKIDDIFRDNAACES